MRESELFMENMTFEKALFDLEEIIAKLEKGELSLEQSIEVYEQGVRLTAFCNKELKNAKLKIEELQKDE